jgi:hypothetical protein
MDDDRLLDVTGATSTLGDVSGERSVSWTSFPPVSVRKKCMLYGIKMDVTYILLFQFP